MIGVLAHTGVSAHIRVLAQGCGKKRVPHDLIDYRIGIGVFAHLCGDLDMGLVVMVLPVLAPCTQQTDTVGASIVGSTSTVLGTVAVLT